MAQGQMTEKQAGLLQKHRWYNDGLSFDEASHRIDQIAKNSWKKPANPVPFKPAPAAGGAPRRSTTAAAAPPARQTKPATGGGELDPNGPPTVRQEALLVKFGYEPGNYTFTTAGTLIDELRANDWKPLDDASEPADQYEDDIPFGN